MLLTSQCILDLITNLGLSLYCYILEVLFVQMYVVRIYQLLVKLSLYILLNKSITDFLCMLNDYLFAEQPPNIKKRAMKQHNRVSFHNELVNDDDDDDDSVGLLVGPCSLEYSKLKTPDHCWTDPTASELIQRHRIHTSAKQHGLLLRGGSPQRPALRVSPRTRCIVALLGRP